MDRALKAVAAMMLMMFFAVGCNKPIEPSHGDDVNEHNGHEYVDLGLPSGILWATCNVGADTPEGFGDYLAWGETAPKDIYDWKSYRYGNFRYDRYELNKYCTDSCYGLDGFVDELVILEPGDDAARACWGGDWRMPTKEEWEEVFQNTACTLAVQNGVKGRLFTGCNGNSIFLPFTGFRLDGEFIGPALGIYWSSSLHSGFPERGWSFHYDMDEFHVCGTYERSRGQVVRPVRVKK